jgi:phosphoribosylformylglycinamidine synthase
MAQPRVLILRAPGTNCDEEAAYAWNRAGAQAAIWHVGRILENPARLSEFAVLTIPGGFSYGDDLGAGRVFASRLNALGDALGAFHEQGGLILGICNGFQVLVRAGILPGPRIGAATLAHNASGRFEARWVRLGPNPARCVFLPDNEPIDVPVAHGEGRFLLAEPGRLATLESQGQIAVRYLDAADAPTPDYPANPNGSLDAIAGVCDSTGRIFGLMPHPERFIDPHLHPRWTRDGARPVGDGLRIFQHALKAVR